MQLAPADLIVLVMYLPNAQPPRAPCFGVSLATKGVRAQARAVPPKKGSTRRGRGAMEVTDGHEVAHLLKTVDRQWIVSRLLFKVGPPGGGGGWVGPAGPPRVLKRSLPGTPSPIDTKHTHQGRWRRVGGGERLPSPIFLWRRRPKCSSVGRLPKDPAVGCGKSSLLEALLGELPAGCAHPPVK